MGFYLFKLDKNDAYGALIIEAKSKEEAIDFLNKDDHFGHERKYWVFEKTLESLNNNEPNIFYTISYWG